MVFGCVGLYLVVWFSAYLYGYLCLAEYLCFALAVFVVWLSGCMGFVLSVCL